MPGQLYHIYCDESSTGKGHAYMALGGIMLEGQRAHALAASVAKWRQQVNMKRELKWSRVARQRYQQYAEFVRGVMHYIKERELCFRCLVLDQQKLDYKKFHDGSEGLGYNRFLYQLVRHGFMSFIKEEDRLCIFIDERRSTHPLKELRECLNWAAYRDLGWSHEPVMKIEPVSSKKCTIMQMNDVLLGAVAHQNNRREDVPGRDQSKVDLAAYVAQLAGLEHLRLNSPRSMTNFNIWQFRLAEKKRPRS